MLPNSLLVGLAEPLAEGLGPPDRLHAAGRGPLHRAAARSVQRRSQTAHRPAGEARGSLPRRQRLLRELHGGVPRACRASAIETVPLGITLSGHAPVDSGPSSGPSRSATSPASRPRRGCTFSPRPTGSCGPSSASRRPGSRSRATWVTNPGATSPRSRAKLGAAGLGGEFRYHGTLDRGAKIRFLQRLDVISVPSPYVEPKGLYLLEALANGVPFVQPGHGAFPEIHERTGGGVLTEPGDTHQLAEALLGLARDPERRRELGRRGAAAVQERFGVARMAERTEAVLGDLAAGAPGASVPAPDQVGHGEQPSPLQGESNCLECQAGDEDSFQ